MRECVGTPKLSILVPCNARPLIKSSILRCFCTCTGEATLSYPIDSPSPKFTGDTSDRYLRKKADRERQPSFFGQGTVTFHASMGRGASERARGRATKRRNARATAL